MADDRETRDAAGDGEQLEFSDLLSHVLDKGVVVSGQVTIAVADIDLMVLDLRLLLSAMETILSRSAADGSPTVRGLAPPIPARTCPGFLGCARR